MPLSKTKGKGPQLFRGDDSSDDDAAPRAGSKQLSDTEMASASADEEPGKGGEAGASSSKVKGKRKATGRGRTSSVSSTATGKSVALSDTSLADMQAQRDAEAGAAGVEPELDPNIIASIPVYLARSVQRDSSLQVFQYPNYAYRRPLPVPESAAQRGETESARWRKNANWVEVDLPLDIRQGVYNADKGETMGANIADSKGPKAKKEDSARTDPKRLDKVKLTSNHIPNSTRYLIGVIRDGALHLTQLSSVLQLRPSLHHLDANDQAEAESKRRARDADAASMSDDGGAASKAKQQAKARSVTVTVREDPNAARGRSGTSGGGSVAGQTSDAREKMMAVQREAEAEPWKDLSWLREETEEARRTFSAQLFAGSKKQLACSSKPSDYLRVAMKPTSITID